MQNLRTFDAASVRAAIARSGRLKYQVAAVVGCHPCRLSRMLNEREPLPRKIAERILAALEDRRASNGD